MTEHEDAADQPDPAAVISQIGDVFARAGYAVVEATVDGRTFLQTDVEGSRGTWEAVATVSEDGTAVMVNSLIPLVVAPERRADVAVVLHAINWRLVVGAFDLDPTSGRVRFRTGTELPPEGLPDALAHSLVYSNLQTTDHFLGDVLDAIAGTRSVEQILAGWS